VGITESALLFSARNRDMSISGETINLTFDIITQERHEWSLKASTHSVEEGAPFTDHIQKEIRKANLVGLISNFGLKRGELTSNYAQDTFDLFEQYRDNAVQVTIVTTLKVYEDFIITKVGVARSGSSGEAQSFMVAFQEFRTVKLKITEGIAEIKISSSDLETDADAQQASPNADTGEQNAEDPLNNKLERFINFTDFASGAYK
jgi:hypothetical protein